MIDIRSLFTDPHPDPIEWLEKFQTEIGRGPTAVASSLVQILSDEEDEEGLTKDCSLCRTAKNKAAAEGASQAQIRATACEYCQLFGWLKANHRPYGRAVWQIIESVPGLRGKLRRVIQRDLEIETDMPGYGKIVLKTYGRNLLDNFLTAKPNPTWVG